MRLKYQSEQHRHPCASPQLFVPALHLIISDGFHSSCGAQGRGSHQHHISCLHKTLRQPHQFTTSSLQSDAVVAGSPDILVVTKNCICWLGRSALVPLLFWCWRPRQLLLGTSASIYESLSDDNVSTLLSGCQRLALHTQDVCTLCLGLKDASRYMPTR